MENAGQTCCSVIFLLAVFYTLLKIFGADK